MDAVVLASAGFLINLLLGGVIWFMKQSYSDLKEQVKEHKLDLNGVKEHYFKKEDFIEFKLDLWKRLDKIEDKLETTK